MSESNSDCSSKWQKHVHNFDIDNYLNPFIPCPRFYILPRPISHFFGYRPTTKKTAPAPANPIVWLSACIGGFVGIAIITAVYHALPVLGGQQVPLVIASFGAAAILEYNTIESPLAQPRNLIVGHLLSALIGVAITKGFEHLPPQQFDDLRWLAGSISVGVASAAMSITKTVHPPAGATALLASTSVEVTVLGWWLLPLVLLASVLMSASALLINNLTRTWPLYWWTPANLSHRESDTKRVKDVEQEAQSKRLSTTSESTAASTDKQHRHIERLEQDAKLPTQATTQSDDAARIGPAADSMHEPANTQFRIVICPDSIIIPDDMAIDDWGKEVLEIFRQKLATRQPS